MLNSFEELCIMRVAAVYSLARVLNLHGGAYIYIYMQGIPKRCIHTSNNCIFEHFEEEDFYFQQDGAPPHYHRVVTSFLDERLPNRWIGRRGFVKYPPRSPDFFLCRYLKDKVYALKPTTIAELRARMNVNSCKYRGNCFMMCATPFASRYRWCLDQNGHQFDRRQ